MERLLTVKDVLTIVGFSRSGLYKKISVGEFPAPVCPLGKGRSGSAKRMCRAGWTGFRPRAAD